MDIGIDRSIAERTQRQLGLITRTDLDALGINGSHVQRRIDRGILVPVGRRHYRLAGAPRTRHQAVLAACLATGGWASHRTAAALHGLGRFSLGEPIELTVRERTRSKRSRLALVHVTTTLTDDDVTVVDGIPTVTVARALFGLASLVPQISQRQLGTIIDVAIRDGQASDRWLWWRLEELRRSGRNGVSAFERALLERIEVGATESWLERETLELIRSAGLPLPQCQRKIRTRGAFVARVDFLYEHARIVIEVDGHRSHSTREQLAADAARANELQLAGYVVLRFTYDDVVRRRDHVIATIRAALASNTRH